MKKMYFKNAALAMSLLALAGTSAMAEGNWRNVNYLLQNPAFIPGWSGALTAVDQGIGEVYNGAFELYQVLPDMPAGEYKLTCNAFYRYATNDLSKENMGNGANHNAYIFLGDAKKTVVGLFDGGVGSTPEGAEYSAEYAPNWLGEAAVAFAAGKYVNEVTFNLAEEGDLRLGIANTGGRQDEWTAFDNFVLVGPNGPVAIPNGDFAEGLNVDKAQTIWDCDNIAASPVDGAHSQKAPDVNKAGGVYRKTNASPYNFGQLVELEAGKYRFGVQSFLRYGGGNQAGSYVTVKGQWEMVEGESAYDRHAAGSEAESDNAYVYVTDGWDTWADDTKCKPLTEEFAKDAEYGNPDAFYYETPVKCLFDENLDVYPDNEPKTDGLTETGYGWCDSGFEAEAAACFINNPDMYRNYVEFELPVKTAVWVGLKKDVNAPSQYWNPFRDFTLEKYDEAAGVQGVAADMDADANAPVEYYNLQGIRVANPENGLYIVKQGKKVSKQVIR